jgi:hypothetical protein
MSDLSRWRFALVGQLRELKIPANLMTHRLALRGLNRAEGWVAWRRVWVEAIGPAATITSAAGPAGKAQRSGLPDGRTTC